MRLHRLLALAGMLLLPPAARPLLAQDDSTSAVDTVSAADTIETRRPVRRTPGGNPYLREVHQSRQVRRGPYYASFGLGLGDEAIADLGAPSPYTPSRLRPTITAGIGAGVGQALRLGLDGFVWFNITDGALETVTTAMIGARLYPIPSTGLYLRAAGGIGHYGLEPIDDCDCGALESDFGLAYALGGGFEVPVGRGVWFGPSFEVVRMNVTGPAGYRERVVNFGFTLTFDGPKEGESE
jgi:hypothetical protein